MKNLVLIFFSAAVIFMVSCEKEGACDEFKVSIANDDDSHNFGNNCLQCHQANGGGEGCFSVAGSVRNALLTGPQTSGKIAFYTEPNGGGTLKYMVNIDAKGNFYSSQSESVVGLYPAVTNGSGTLFMSSPLSTGACNSCHESSTSLITAP